MPLQRPFWLKYFFLTQSDKPFLRNCTSERKPIFCVSFCCPESDTVKGKLCLCFLCLTFHYPLCVVQLGNGVKQTEEDALGLEDERTNAVDAAAAALSRCGERLTEAESDGGNNDALSGGGRSSAVRGAGIVVDGRPKRRCRRRTGDWVRSNGLEWRPKQLIY